MGIASGVAELRGDDYFGPTLNTAARVMAAGHGGQVLRAASTASLVDDVVFVDLGLRALRDLSAPVQLFQVCAEGLRADFPALRTLDAVPGNLRAQNTSFIGRDDAVDIVVDAVGSHPLVTLIGVGGVGKTRLALQSAAILAPGFRDGGWLIELAAVTDGAGVDAAVAAVFMLQPQPGRTWRQVVVGGLQSREVLLVIDNCEHVLDDTAALVEALAGCLQVRVLVTSRESLAVPTEWAWWVPSLPGAAGIELFVERADASASGRSIERHQTLRHAVQWSYDLLDPVEQTVLQAVSVFVGGFTLDAASAITVVDEYDVLDIIDSLVRKSLLNVERAETAVRYAMLETIRQFGEEALAGSGFSEDVRDRHAAYFADRSDDAREQFLSNDVHLAHRFVDNEITNLATAFGGPAPGATSIVRSGSGSTSTVLLER